MKEIFDTYEKKIPIWACTVTGLEWTIFTDSPLNYITILKIFHVWLSIPINRVWDVE